jgi:hypothetical protein
MRRLRTLTLVEVVVALAVLAIGFASLLSIMAMSSKRAAKAEAKWDASHRLSQATEFFLLCGPQVRIDERFLTYQGANAECRLEKVEGLPDGVEETRGQWRLAHLHIQLFQDGAPAASLDIEKILKAEDCK